jgi:hypothetical protein
VGKKQNIIHINGKRYDAHTGAPLDREHRASSPAIVKPIAIKHTPETTRLKARHHSTKRAAKPVAHHKPQRSTTLMRQAVHKPGASLTRRIKVQSHTGALTEQPSGKIVSKLSFGAANHRRLDQANRIKRSDLIMHFNPRQPGYSTERITVTINPPAAKPKPVPRQPAPEIDDIFERAIQQATSHLEPAPKKARKHHFRLARKHARA